MAAIPPAVTISGVNTTFWSAIGFLRFLKEEIVSPPTITKAEEKLILWIEKHAVAVCIPAKSEESGIARTIRSLKNQVGARNIFVVSDGSTDNTAKIARGFRVKVAELTKSKGKAGALKYLIDHYNLLEKYLFILFVDADTHIDSNYVKYALPYFADPQIVAVAGHAKTAWRKHFWPKWEMFFIAYRDKLYNFLQYTIRYGQTAKWTNVSPIVPGFASIYRTSGLKQININEPGLVIEDFNMTFQIHNKKLGKIAYHPKVFGIARDPTNFTDYVAQVRRWNLGFWQTFIKQGINFNFFTFALVVMVLESLLSTIFFLALPITVLLILVNSFPTYFSPLLLGISGKVGSYITLLDIILLFILGDYLLTAILAVLVKRPQHLIYGLGYPLLRFVDAIIILSTLPQAFFSKSTGVWVSPSRK